MSVVRSALDATPSAEGVGRDASGSSPLASPSPRAEVVSAHLRTGQVPDLADDRSRWVAPSGVSNLAQLIVQVRTVATALAQHLPDPSDGIAWVDFDSALSGLHRALVALSELDQGRGSTRTSADLVLPVTEPIVAERLRRHGGGSALRGEP